MDILLKGKFDVWFQIELCGCKNVSEEALQFMIWKWEETVTEFNMAATNIGMIQQGYQASVKVDGCPMMSPTEQTFIDGERKSKSHSFV